MQPSARRLAAVLVALCAWMCASAALRTLASADAQIAFAPCGDSNDFACGHLTVPLVPAGVTPGTITLAIRRHRAAVGEAHSAIVALAGGPGQPALPFTEEFAELLGPIAATRDLIVFDQRGIGLSDPLSCHAFERMNLYTSIGGLVEACGDQLGAARGFYTTADTVADIEAIRQAGGYEKLVLYGTSYGTKVAEQYAQDYPSHVEALVLDSVVPPNGPEPLSRSTFAAIPRILSQICAQRACAHVTSHPVADLARVLARMAHGPLRGRAIGERGATRPVALSSEDLLGLLLAGDFSPLLRAEFVTAVAAGARHDTAPLARLVRTAEQAEGEESEDFDTPLYYATTCEEQDFPWSRAADPAGRIAQAAAAARSLPPSAFAPFTAADALELSDVEACAHWPFTTPSPPVDDRPLPNVPTLILSGADDLRTPTANAREVAAQIPDSHLLVVPHTGHSVLTEEQTPCASEALRALFAATPIEPCSPAAAPASLRPAPLPPTRLAQVAPVEGSRGVPGRTLHSVELTLEDLVRELSLRLTLGGVGESAGVPSLDVGGLRAGWAELTDGALRLHDYSYVPGVTVSGMIRAESEDLEVGGSSAAHGTLLGAPHKALAGVLGGHRVVLPAKSVATAAIVVDDAPESSHPGAGDSAARRAARMLAQLLAGSRP